MISIKRPAEIEGMRRAGASVSEVLEKVRAFVAPGLTTREIDEFAAERIREVGAKSAFLGYRGFPGNICISVNEEVVHGIGGSRRLQVGDIVKLDVGIIKDGWIGDTATTVPVGVVDANVSKLLSVTQQSLAQGIAQARDGNRVGDISAAVEEYVIRHGFSVVRDMVGHGVGTSMHEPPEIPNFGRRGTGEKIRPGMTLAIEPMVNLGGYATRVLPDGWTVVSADSSPSAHFEHTVLTTDKGPEILTVPGLVTARPA